MLQINQNSTISKEYAKIIKTFMQYKVYLDLDEILIDLEKLDSIKNKTNKETVKINVDNIVKYLMQISRYYNQNKTVEIKAKWDNTCNKINVQPFEVRKLKKYGIDAINYFKVKDCIILELDYTELINAINFECMYRDLGYTDEYIEDKLKDLGIFSIHDSKELGFIDNTDKGMKLEVKCSPKYDSVEKCMYDYFGNKVKSNKYKDVIEQNSRFTLNCICDQLMHKIDNSVTIWRVCDNVITLCISNDDLEVIQEMLNGINCRLFGRNFYFNSKKNIISIEGEI